jgi:hypothetical protein
MFSPAPHIVALASAEAVNAGGVRVVRAGHNGIDMSHEQGFGSPAIGSEAAR